MANLTCSNIATSLMWALTEGATGVCQSNAGYQGNDDPLPRALSLGVPKGHLMDAVRLLLKAVKEAALAFMQIPSSEAIKCLCEAKIHFPDSEGAGLAISLGVYFILTHSCDDFNKAMSIKDKFVAAGPSQNVECVRLLAGLVGVLAVEQFWFYGKPEYMKEAAFYIHMVLSTMSCEDPDSCNLTQWSVQLKKDTLQKAWHYKWLAKR